MDIKKLLDEKVNLNKIDHELFDRTAEQIALKLNDHILSNTKNKRSKKESDVNKSTQIRRFYDDILAWESQLMQIPSLEDRERRYAQILPMIKMLNAKVAYAHNRGHVDDQFKVFINHCIRQLQPDSLEGFKHFKLLFEAVIGFMKQKKIVNRG